MLTKLRPHSATTTRTRSEIFATFYSPVAELLVVVIFIGVHYMRTFDCMLLGGLTIWIYVGAMQYW